MMIAKKWLRSCFQRRSWQAVLQPTKWILAGAALGLVGFCFVVVGLLRPEVAATLGSLFAGISLLLVVYSLKRQASEHRDDILRQSLLGILERLNQVRPEPEKL